MTYAEANAAREALEAQFDEACVTYRAALTAFRRSKSAKNFAALHEAEATHERLAAQTLAACDVAARVHSAEVRAARIAARPAAPVQLALFA
ncbi:hypothetical protein [Phenylobacterium ferrooxidans]|uniref:Uncharacterized protein n=1 Tax=Phenylobacterium ferrooxidans TaxID=2982689 RepID=A0ABW6CJB5_9CAUL